MPALCKHDSTDVRGSVVAMSEYIITDKQLGLIQDFANVCVEDEKLPNIVRCRDCVWLKPRDEENGGRNWCKNMSFETEPDGFCAWGERK